MAPIPRYWHVETDPPGLSFQPLPIPTVWPVPAGGLAHLIDDATGEVYGQAILMCALPWPRFRDFATGKEVVLPSGMAETLEGLEPIVGAVHPEDMTFPCGHQLSDRGYHLRVEVCEAKVFASFHCNCTFPLDRRKHTAVKAGR